MATAKVRKQFKTSAVKRDTARGSETGMPKIKLGGTPKLLKGKKPAAMLVDAEILMYHVTAHNLDEVYHRDRDVYTWEINRANARADFKERIIGLAKWMKATRIIVAWGGGNCFRRAIIGSYKLKRLRIKKPLGYWELVEWARKQGDWQSISWPRLEADDVLGIFATDPKLKRTHTPVIVSDDKDLRTVPGLHLTFRSLEDEGAAQGLFDVTREEADRFHLIQTLTGDKGDGYFGLSGTGPARAEQILAGTGPNPKAREALPPLSVWERIVWAYENEELHEHQAMCNAQCAHILRHGDFDPSSNTIKMWEPSNALRRRPKKAKIKRG